MTKALSYDVAVNSRTGSKRQPANKQGRAQNAVASMSYALGKTLYDEQEQDPTKQRKRYSGKEEVSHAEIIAPAGAPDWVFNPQELANRVERSETRKNSQLMRSHILALPNELDHEARLSICRDFAQTLADKGQVIAFAMHDAPGNSHAHFLCTMRELDETGPQGFSKHKQREWNDFQVKGKGKDAPNLTDQARTWLETRVNQEMEKAGHNERVIYTSYEANGIDKEPTHHIGPAASALEKREGESERGTENIRKVKHQNAVNEAIRGERTEAEYGDAAIKQDDEKRRQERPERKRRERRRDQSDGTQQEHTETREERTHRDAVERSRQGARQWQRGRVLGEAAPQHDDAYNQARELQAKYLNRAWQSWRRGETGVTVAQNAETRAKLAARAEPETTEESTHRQALGAAMRASLTRAGQGAAVLINRMRDYLDRKPANLPEPERAQETPGRGSVFDALRRTRGNDNNLETARNDQNEQERRRGYDRK